MPSNYEQALDQLQAEHARQQNLTGSIRTGAMKDPDAYARVLETAAKTGYAAPMVEEFQPDIELDQKVAEINPEGLMRNAPVLAEFMSNPDYAGISHDDVATLKSINSAAGRARFAMERRLAEERKKRGDSWLGGLGNAVVTSINRLVAMPLDLQETIADASGRVIGRDAAGWLKNAVRFLNPVGRVARSNVEQLKRSEMATEDVFLKDPITGEEFFNFQGTVNPLNIESWKNASKLVAGELPAMVAMIAAEAGSGGAATPAFLARYGKYGHYIAKAGKMAFSRTAAINTGRVVQGARQEGVQTLMDRGMSREDAEYESAGGALLSGALATPASALEADFTMGVIRRIAAAKGGGALLKRIASGVAGAAGGAAQEGTQEVLEGLGQDVAEMLTYDQGKEWKEVVKNAITNFYGGAVVGGGIHASLSAMAQSSEQSKLRPRSPEAFKQTVAAMVEGGSESFLMPVEKFQTYFQGQNMDPEQVALALGVKNYQEAVEAGSDVVVDTAEFMTRMPDQWQGIEKDVKFEASSMTPNEFESLSDAEIEAMSSRIQADAATEGKAAQTSSIREKIYTQLVDSGRNPSTAQTEATLVDSVYRTIATRNNIDPDLLFNTFDVRVLMGRLNLGGGKRQSVSDAFIEATTRAMQPVDLNVVDEDFLNYQTDMQPLINSFQELGIDPSQDPESVKAQLFEASQDPAKADAIERFIDAAESSKPVQEFWQKERIKQPKRTTDIGKRQREQMRRALTPSMRSKFDTEQSKQIEAERKEFEDFDRTLRDAIAGDIRASGDPNAMVRFGEDYYASVVFFEKANLSSFIHEMGHIYLNIMMDLSERPDAPQQVKDDYLAMLKFAGYGSPEQRAAMEQEASDIRSAAAMESRDLTKKEQKRLNALMEPHEVLARAHEAYIMEGKAPSEELREAFGRARNWMVLIYKMLKNLFVKMNPEIRQVFDRLYATDHEIKAALEYVGRDRKILAKDLGMTEVEYERMLKRSSKADLSSTEKGSSKILAQLKRERTAWWNEQVEKMRPGVAAEVESDPVRQAFEILIAGKLPSGEAIKLDKDSLAPYLNGQAAKTLPRRRERIYSTTGGVDPETAAEVLGFENGVELIEALKTVNPKTDEVINQIIDQRMKEEHGDLLSDGSIADAAMDIIHDEGHAEVIAAEYKQMVKLKRKTAKDRQIADLKGQIASDSFWSRGVVAEIPPLEMFRSAAEEIIDAKEIRDLVPNAYLVAQRRHSREAFDALSKKDYTKAADSKRKELLNHFLYRVAMDRVAAADDMAAYAIKGQKTRFQSKLGLAGITVDENGRKIPSGMDYQFQWNQIAERFNFRRETNKAIDAREQEKIDAQLTLPDFVKKLEEEQINTGGIAPYVLNERNQKNFRQLTFPQLQAVYDALKNIEHAAMTQLEFETEGRKQEYAAKIEQFKKDAYNFNKAKSIPRQSQERTAAERVRNALRFADAYMLKLEWMVDRLDGGKIDGVAREMIIKPIADGSGRKAKTLDELYTKIIELNQTMPEDFEAEMLRPSGVVFPGDDKVLSYKELVSWAMNLGTEENFKVATEGHGLVDEDGNLRPEYYRAIKTLKSYHWDYVKGIMEITASLWPKIEAKERRTTGVVPKKKVNRKIVVERTADGKRVEFEGDYFPLKMDPIKAGQAFKQDPDNLITPPPMRPNVSSSHTKQVTGKVYPLYLDYSAVLGRHLEDVVTNVEMGEAMQRVYKFITDPQVKKTISETLSPEYYNMLAPWLTDSVRMRGDSKEVVDRVLLHVRTAMVTAKLAGNLTSYLVQATDWLKPWQDMASRYGKAKASKMLLEAAWQIRRDPKAMTQMIRDKSPNEMRFRERNVNREIAEAMATRTPFKKGINAVSEFLFSGFAVMDRLQSFPAWLAEYNEVMKQTDDEETAIASADRLIARDLQTGQARNMSAMMRAPGLTKLFTTFAGDANGMYGIISSAVGSKNASRIMVAIFATVAAQMLAALLRADIPSDDEDETWGGWATKQALAGMTQTIPIIGDLVQKAALSLAGGRRQSFQNPTLDAMEKVFIRTPAVFSSEDADLEEKMQALVEAGTIIGGVPWSGQIMKSWKYNKKVREGEEQPDNAWEAAVGYITGRGPK